MLDRLAVPVAVHTPAGPLTIRRARPDDVRTIMTLLADDAVGARRGDVIDPQDEPIYAAALQRVLADPGNDLVIAEREGQVIGTLQLTLIPGMSRLGSDRVIVEAVRVASSERSAGIGAALLRWVMHDAAVQLGAGLVQLTSDAARTDARRFYLRLGFVDSHVGFKYLLPAAAR
ncbi:GNAT family N-acetyltransferase [Nakamurella flava]|uniref:GNAT family N-acetyltransferase n=1 Tax=Nakamurella flava TaxID=2576308 RepID=A0A4U6QEZ0_9ACTN|nr:GNAT family N-acetyltransferase [Nakamurella flava]TKV58592.1 GNAT family N-acetyltransferase [Nakamurella flava]